MKGIPHLNMLARESKELFDAADGLAYVIEKQGIHGKNKIRCDYV
jgi:hypothetical protein